MDLDIELRPAEETLVVTLTGNLDMRSTYPLLSLAKLFDPRAANCVLDLRDIRRVFDSGLVTLQIFATHLDALGIAVHVLESDSDTELPQAFDGYFFKALGERAVNFGARSSSPSLATAPI